MNSPSIQNAQGDHRAIQVLAFDIFGTVVDWHGSIQREMAELYPQVDGDAFALAWRKGYQPAMARVMQGELPWTLIDDLHRLILDGLLSEFGLDHLSEAQKKHLNRVWHRLQPWPDTVAALHRLKQKYIFAPCPMAMSIYSRACPKAQDCLGIAF